MEEEEEPAVSPTGSSLLPPLEDMSNVPRIHANVSQRDQEGQAMYQEYQVDQRELNVDQRSIQLQHNIFNPDPSVVVHLAASAAASEIRAEATHAVSAVMTEATTAVAAARVQTSEAFVRAEATQAVAQARETAMEFELRSLGTMVESLRAENNDLRDSQNDGISLPHCGVKSKPWWQLNIGFLEWRTSSKGTFFQAWHTLKVCSLSLAIWTIK